MSDRVMSITVPVTTAEVFAALRAGLRVTYEGTVASARGAVISVAHGCDCVEECQEGPAVPRRIEVEAHLDYGPHAYVEIIHIRPGSFRVHTEDGAGS